MACLLKSSICVLGLVSTFPDSRSKLFMGRSIGVKSDQRSSKGGNVNVKNPSHSCINAKASACVTKSMRWWEKTLMPNMVEIHSAQQLVDSLRGAGGRLVIVDFYSPGCGGCKALHPKICQLAESNPDAVFLKVNYEELKTMCHNLHIHVLPFFRFYRGAEGRSCSFSCTNATIKKFKDALAKFGTEGHLHNSSVGPAKGLDDSELVALASSGQISWNLVPESSESGNKMEDFVERETHKMGSKETSVAVIA